jgi:hypothetical protein
VESSQAEQLSLCKLGLREDLSGNYRLFCVRMTFVEMQNEVEFRREYIILRTLIRVTSDQDAEKSLKTERILHRGRIAREYRHSMRLWLDL